MYHNFFIHSPVPSVVLNNSYSDTKLNQLAPFPGSLPQFSITRSSGFGPRCDYRPAQAASAAFAASSLTMSLPAPPSTKLLSFHP